MAEVRLTLEEYEALRRMISSERESEGAMEEAKAIKKKPKRVSKYHKELGIQWKKLKVKHPRTQAKDLLSRAHKATRKKLGMKRRR